MTAVGMHGLRYHVCFLLIGARSAACFLCDVVIYRRPSKHTGES